MKKSKRIILDYLSTQKTASIKEIQQHLKKSHRRFVNYKKLQQALKQLKTSNLITALPDQLYGYIPEALSAGTKAGTSRKKSLTVPIGADQPWLVHSGDPKMDIPYILTKYQFRTKFSSKIQEEISYWSNQVDEMGVLVESQIPFRKDYRHLPIYTIDPVHAKDFDDAVGIEATDYGFHLWVHIADVSFFINEKSHTDQEARYRGNTVYLAWEAITMLPEKITQDFCSLTEGQPKFTVSVELDYDHDGTLMNSNLYLGIIQVTKRLDYEGAQNLLDANPESLSEEDQAIRNRLDIMLVLSRKLFQKRIEQGSLDMNVPKFQIVYDASTGCYPIDVKPERKLDTNSIIEEFMLAANQIVASEMVKKPIGLYRLHDVPNEEDLEDFYAVLNRTHLSDAVSQERKSSKLTKKKRGSSTQSLPQIINQLKHMPESRVLSYLLLRSMNHAYYSPKSGVHFALQFPTYTHFTSPIRRYSDLVVHRLIKQYAGLSQDSLSLPNQSGSHSNKGPRFNEKLLNKIASRISKTEVRTEKAERELNKRKAAYFMKDKVGNVYEGYINWISANGFFVEIQPYGIDGFCRRGDLGAQMTFQEKEYLYISYDRKIKYQLGDRIHVQIARVDIQRVYIDLVVVPDPVAVGSEKQL